MIAVSAPWWRAQRSDWPTTKRLGESVRINLGRQTRAIKLVEPSQGEVIAVGNGQIRENGDVRALDVKVGDKVLFGQYAGSTVKVDGEELLIMKESDVLGVIEG